MPTIIEMVNLTRLDCTLGSATSMRTGLARAIHHAQHRKAFGAYLIDQPLMRNVLADLAVEAEAATMVAMRMAGATDAAVRGDERETLLRRIGLAAGKYWVCKRATPHAAEAMECLGGNGYVEESGMPRLYREAPLMGIWEGSGNVSALDTLRAMATRPECVDVLFDELATTTGPGSAAGRPRRRRSSRQLGRLETIQYRARKVAEDISLALQGSLLVRHGHPAVAEAFLATRMGGAVGRRVRNPAHRAGSRADPRARVGQGMSFPRASRRKLGREIAASSHAATNAGEGNAHDARDQARRLRQPEDDDLRGHRPGCAHHVQPPRKGQRDHRRHPAGAVRARRARRPRPRRARDPGVRSRRRASAPASTCPPTPRARRRQAAAVPTRTPCCRARRRPSTICPISRGIR